MKNHAHPHNSAETHGSLRLVSTSVDEAPVQPDRVVEVYARQTGELVAMVAAALREEHARHAAAVRSLRAVEGALAEQQEQLAALATHATETVGDAR